MNLFKGFQGCSRVSYVFKEISESFRRIKDIPKGFKRFQKSSRDVAGGSERFQGHPRNVLWIPGTFRDVTVNFRGISSIQRKSIRNPLTILGAYGSVPGVLNEFQGILGVRDYPGDLREVQEDQGRPKGFQAL